MIKQGHLKEEEIKLLTRAEAKAFVIFLVKERERHWDDINNIDETIEIVFEVHKFDDYEIHPYFWYDRERRKIGERKDK